ncbi:MAG: CoA transferase, partial [Pararhodobacter sp.]|nr:CoA transferase [Pararhodobacter sp.]
GMAYMTGPRGQPLRIGSSANDIMAGLFAAFSVVAALIARGRRGQGAALRVGLFENCLLLVAQHMVQFAVEGTESPPMPEREFSWPVYDLFTTRDGRQIFVGAATDGQWQKLCRGLGLDDLLADPGLQTRPQQIAARAWVLPRIAAVIEGQDQAALIALCDRHHLLYAPVARPAEMYQDPHVNRPGGLMSSEFPGKRAFRAPGLPIEIDAQPLLPGLLDVPAPGQHNAEILGPQDAGQARDHG